MNDARLKSVLVNAVSGLLNAFLAQAGTLGSTLTCFELRVALTNNIESAFALHDLTVFVAPLHGHE